MGKYLTLALLILGLAGCGEAPTEAPTEVPPDQDTDYGARGWLAKSLPEIVDGMDSGEVTSQELVSDYLDRIERLDRKGPQLQSVIALNPNALDEAKKLDRLRGKGKVLGRLHGVPILLKDNIESKEPLPTTAGSYALIDNVTLEDAPLVAGLRREGAIILGKTNLSEWANFRSRDSMSGWSAVGGQVKNPHMLDRNPCGSSSGSGAAAAASLAAAAVGTETNGSVICPATTNGIVGFKPTVGLISQEGIVPISFSQDTAGPMTKSVRGTAMLLAAMDDREVDYEGHLDADALKGKRIGVARFAVGEDKSIWPLFDAALLVLESKGAEIVEIETRYELPETFQSMGFQVLLYEFKKTINDYLREAPGSVASRSLRDLIEFNASHERELALFDQSIFDVAVEIGSIEEVAYQSARASIDQATQSDGIDRYLDEYDVDLIVVPSGIPSPRRDPVNGDVWPPFVGIGWMAAVAGYPHATVPMGAVNKLPVGLSLIGAKDQDIEVLAAAYAYEQASLARVEPHYLKDASEIPHIGKALAAP